MSDSFRTPLQPENLECLKLDFKTISTSQIFKIFAIVCIFDDLFVYHILV